jgi:hypothetical protein
MRAVVAHEYVHLISKDSLRSQLDRKGQSLSSGGDSDMAFVALDLGMGMGLFPTLKLCHLMPAQRINPDYLQRLIEAIAYSSVIVLNLRGIPPACASRPLIYRIADLYTSIRMPKHIRMMEAAKMRGESNAIRALKCSPSPQ